MRPSPSSPPSLPSSPNPPPIHQRRRPHNPPPSQSLMDQYIPSTSDADLLPWVPDPHVAPGISASSTALAGSSFLPPPRRSVSYEDRLSAAAIPSVPASASAAPTPRTKSTIPKVATPRSPVPPASSLRSRTKTDSPGSPTAAASKYDMKRLLSKPAPPSSSMGSSFFSSTFERDPQENLLAISLGSNSDSSFLRPREVWSPDAPMSGKMLHETTSPASRSRHSSNVSRQTQQKSQRSRTLTQTSVTSGSQSSHALPADYSLVEPPSRRSPHATDDFGPPRAMTPASAIAYAYQQSQQSQLYQHRHHQGSGSQSGSGRPSPSGSFYPSSSSEGPLVVGPKSTATHDYLRTPITSPRSAIASSPCEKQPKSTSGFRNLTRKVSGKFSKGRSSTTGSASRRGTIAAGEEPLSGSLGSSSLGSGFLIVGGAEFEEVSSSLNSSSGERDRGSGGGKYLAADPVGRSSSQQSRSHSTLSQSQHSHSDYFPGGDGPPPPPAPPPTTRKLVKSKSKSFLRLSATRSASDPPATPATPGTFHADAATPSPPGSAGGNVVLRLMKKLSSSTLREKRNAPLSPMDTMPPVPPLPQSVSARRRSSVSDDHDYGVVVGRGGGETGDGVLTSRHPMASSGAATSGKRVGRNRSGTVVSSQQHQAPQPPVPSKSGMPWPQQHDHKRSLSQSRATTSASSATGALSSSPISSDLSSSRFFFGRAPGGDGAGQMSMSTYSPRTSTSSYLPPDLPPLPPTKKQVQVSPQKQSHHIMPPDAILAAMMEEYGDDVLDGGYASASGGFDDDWVASPNYHGRSTRRPTAVSSAAHSGPLPPPKHHGLSAPPLRRRSPDQSRSREPSTSRKSSASAVRDASPDAKSVRSTTKKNASGAMEPPPSLPMHWTNESNVLSARYVAVQGGVVGEADTPPVSAAATAFTASPTVETPVPKPSPMKRGMFQRLGRSKSEAQIANPIILSPTTLPPPRRSPDSPPASLTMKKRWSIVNDRRGSASSGGGGIDKRLSLTDVNASPTRAGSFDYSATSPPPSASRPMSFSTTVAFRELTGSTVVKRTEDEKMRMWDRLLEKSEKAGGTLHAKIDSSVGFY